MSKIADFIGEKIKARRKGLGLSQGEFAEKTGLSIALISEIERGIANPKLSTLEKISAFLAIQPAELIDTEGYIGNSEHTKRSIYDEVAQLDTKQIKIIQSIIHLLKQ